MLNNLLAIPYDVYSKIQLVMLIITALCALFVIFVVLIQPSNSNGISSITGNTTDTFYGKNKTKSISSTFKKLTVICLILMALFMITYFLFELLLPVGA